MLIDWIIFLHVTSAFAFFAAHGVSVGVAFRLRKERAPERLHALLDFSKAFGMSSNISLLVLLGTGVAAGFMAHLWDKGWLWTALGLVILVSVLMGASMSPFFDRLRKLAGGSYREGGKLVPAGGAATADEVEAMIARFPLTSVTLVGVVISTAILYLMMFKPF